MRLESVHSQVPGDLRVTTLPSKAPEHITDITDITDGALQGFKKGPIPSETILGPPWGSTKGRFLSRHFWGPPGSPWGSKKGRFLSKHFWGPQGFKKGDGFTDDNFDDDFEDDRRRF